MDNMPPEEHIYTYYMTCLQSFEEYKSDIYLYCIDEDMIKKKTIMTLIFPELEYAATAWSPSKKNHIRKLERIQRTATKLSLG